MEDVSLFSSSSFLPPRLASPRLRPPLLLARPPAASLLLLARLPCNEAATTHGRRRTWLLLCALEKVVSPPRTTWLPAS